MKIEKDLEQTKVPGIMRIANHLLGVAKTDLQVKETLCKEHKSLDEMYKYINEQARKQSVNGSAMIEDDTVFGWAQHYYDEDDIMKKEKSIPKSVKEEVKEIELPEDDLDMFDL